MTIRSRCCKAVAISIPQEEKSKKKKHCKVCGSKEDHYYYCPECNHECCVSMEPV